MSNVVPFPQRPSASPPGVRDVGSDVRKAIFLLDLALHQTCRVINRCPEGGVRDGFERQSQEMRSMLATLRAISSSAFPVQDRSFV